MSQIPNLLFGPVNIALDMFNRNRLVNIFSKCSVFDKEVGWRTNFLIGSSNANFNYFGMFFFRTDIQARDLFQLQEGKSTHAVVFDGNNIVNFDFNGNKFHCHGALSPYIFETFTMVWPSIPSNHRLPFGFVDICIFHTQSLHTICCTELSTKVSS